MNYHIAGLISSLFFAMSLAGMMFQIQLVWKRKADHKRGIPIDGGPTSILSLNRFFSGFVSYYAMFLYGLCLTRFNHYLVWPRIIALILLLTILYEIMIDRRTRAATGLFYGSVFLIFTAIFIALLGFRAQTHDTYISRSLMLLAMILFVQGSTHQVLRIRRSGRTGGLSLRMYQLFFMKDFSSAIFGIAMGIGDGWPVILFHVLSMIAITFTLWHFRWVNFSPLARLRRQSSGII